MLVKLTPKLVHKILNDARVLAHQHISEMMDKYKHNNNDFVWLRDFRTNPGVDDFVFMYKNQCFSVLIKLSSGKKSIMSSDIDQTFWNFTRQNNIIPCVFPMELSIYEVNENDAKYKLKIKSPDDWNLVNFNTGNAVTPQELGMSEKIEMSEYELNNFAINIARRFLVTHKGYKIKSICDLPGMSPQMWFIDKQGQPAWLCVGYALGDPSNIPQPDIQELIKVRAKKYNGFFFPIGLQTNDVKLYRRSKINVFCSDLIQIYTAPTPETKS